MALQQALNSVIRVKSGQAHRFFFPLYIKSRTASITRHMMIHVEKISLAAESGGSEIDPRIPRDSREKSAADDFIT